MASKKILKDGLTNKQRILRMIERWDEDIPFERAVYHMYVMKEVMESIKEVEEGCVRDFDEVFDELERRSDEKENSPSDVGQGRKASAGTPRSHRGRRHPKNGEVVRKPAKKIRKRAS
jgi:hypothetical protein